MKFSIVTPNYNYEQYIEETIISVISQKDVDIEYIIVDDGSKDHSRDIIQKYYELYPDIIKPIFQRNQGQTPAINQGFKKATGDIFGWINSDDFFLAEVFKKVNDFFLKNPTVDIVIGDANVVDLNGEFIYRLRHLPFDKNAGVFLGFTRICTSNAVFWKKEIHKKVGAFDDTLKCNMDGDFFSRIMLEGNTCHLEEVFACFRQQPFTKAAENNPEWDNLVKHEVNMELKNSYRKIKISKYLPFSIGRYLKYLYQFKRIVLRMLKMHYFSKIYEKKRYFRNVKG